MSRFCQWYNGSPESFSDAKNLERNPAWVDYQVLSPTLGAITMLLSTKDILPIFVNSRGCVYHIRFTVYAWGPDFGLVNKPLPFLEFPIGQVVNGNYSPAKEQIIALKRIIEFNKPKLIVVLPGDNVILSGDQLTDLAEELHSALNLPIRVLNVSGLSGSNPWVGYDKALELIFDEVWDTNYKVSERSGINLFGWKWPSRERNYDVGVCTSLLNQLEVPVNYILPGGASLSDFSGSLRSSVNLLWCSSYIGQTLSRLETEKGIRIAGRQTPYGFEGTCKWIDELAIALEDPNISKRGRHIRDQYSSEFEEIKGVLKGKRVFVSGGPGRLIGLLQLLADYEMEIVSLALYWIHPNSREDIANALKRFKNQPNLFLTYPSLYELENIARDQQPDIWLGGYQEMHTTKKFNIPFVPTTLYLRSHQGFEGCLTLGKKMIQALNGFDFVANPFVLKESEC